MRILEFVFWSVYSWNARRAASGAEFGGAGVVVVLLLFNLMSLLLFLDMYAGIHLDPIGNSRFDQAAFILAALAVAYADFGRVSRRANIKERLDALPPVVRSRLRRASYWYCVLTVGLFVIAVCVRRAQL